MDRSVAVSAWRRRAIAAFPELRGELNPARRGGVAFGYTYGLLFFDLFDVYRAALDASDEETLRRLFEFARWCFRQQRRAPDLFNTVCVYFYGHLFDVARRDWPDVAPHLFPEVVRACWSLWEARLDEDGIEKLRATFVAARREP